MTNLCLIIRNVYDAHKVILVFLELVCVEEVHHELGDEGDGDQAEDHGHRPEREQLGAERTPVPLSSILELQEEQINIMKTGKYGFSINLLSVKSDLYYHYLSYKSYLQC